ncbi:hypothetical protein JL107_08975 [Nakamurella flavida]|uniref:Uncharacterized protein n=1 Tax=Nakamurella flavida TaxID=363630 RepID=A0A938YP09_9ACTN|nr:hypothetical protein [Nakamurella flavida]MBM9476573.1 hypothetical protein [Nakamurella flavida]MDP9778989.1 hypothetical protein [Nakamurella flavida]
MGQQQHGLGPVDALAGDAGDAECAGDLTWNRPSRRFARWVVRYRARRLGLLNSPWLAVPAAVLALLFVGFVVVRSALPDVSDCSLGEVEIVLSDTPLEGARTLLLLFVVFVLVVPAAILLAADRWAKHRRPIWSRVVQGVALRLTAGVVLTASLLFGWVALDLFDGSCRGALPTSMGWVGFGLFVGVLLAAVGTARRDQAGWVGFALVVNGDLGAAAYLAWKSLQDNEFTPTERLFLMAFAVHAVCVLVAARWAYAVGEHPGSDAVGRAKAGEAGRALAALWTLMGIAVVASAVLESDADIGTDDLFTQLKTPIVVALTWGGLLATTASGFTKYVEGREAAASRLGITQWRHLPTYRDRRMARTVVRMLRALGPLPLSALRAGVDHLEPDRVRSRHLLRAMRVTGCAIEVDGLWTDTRPGRPWPADVDLVRRAQRAGFPTYSRSGMFALLGEVGDADVPRTGRVLQRHPLLTGTGRSGWRVVDGDAERASAAARRGRLAALRRVITPRRTAGGDAGSVSPS